jgi:hypothetical protein
MRYPIERVLGTTCPYGEKANAVNPKTRGNLYRSSNPKRVFPVPGYIEVPGKDEGEDRDTTRVVAIPFLLDSVSIVPLLHRLGGNH